MPSRLETAEALFDVEFCRDVRVPTGTPGVTLSADVYRPVTDRPVPALVTVLPYRKDFVAGAGYAGPARWFAARGYAGLVVDLLGTGASDGVRRPEFDPGDADDALAAIDWAAGRPWCDGAVGMWGLSYAANTTLRAASRRPERLRAIIAVAHGLDPARDSVHPDGARGDLHALVNRGASMLVQQLLPPLTDDTSPAGRRRWRHRLAAGEPVFMDYARHGPQDPVWRQRAIDGAAIDVPALCVGGWRDAFPDGLIDAYEQIRGPKKLLMGPWGHLLPHESAHEPVDFLAVALRWWEHWLGGVPTGVMDEPAVALHLAGTPPRWLGFASWPPPAAELLLAARGDTTLAPATRGDAGPARPIARHEPDATVGALRGLPGLGLGEQFPPQDQHDDDMRSVAVTSAPLAAGLVVGGRPEVRITTAAAGPVGRQVVRLTEVDADGRSVLITAGVLCDPADGDRHVVTLRPIVHAVAAGHRLRVAIGDADFPRLMPLVRPAHFDVTAIEVSVPTLAEAAGIPVDLPELPPPPGSGAPPATGLRITRDQQADEIEVVVDSRITDHRGPGGQHYRLRGELRARVRRAEPETAVTTGTQIAEVRLSTGEVVTASATVLCTQTALRARAELTADGAVVFARSWEAGLVPDSPRA
jgi:putative CocE/NonD family hydrolase